MFGKLLDTASLIKAKLAKDELDQALIQATNQDNWQASTTILHQISSSAYNHQKWQKINTFIWQKLRNNKRWKKMLKALNIVEFLLKNGPQFVIDQLKKDLVFFRTMQSFQAFEDGVDRGASIRQRGRAVVSLLQNEELLQDERVRAKQIRQRMSQSSGNSSFSSQNPQKINSFSNKYESYNSNKNTINQDNKGYYNYGSGNYGDREENKHHRDDYFQHVSRKVQPNKKQQDQIRQEPKVKKIQPIVNLNLKSRKIQQKPSYESMAQKLMKNTASNKKPQVVVPDLSYKNKNTEDLLIDTEAYFVESRYHFQEPSLKQQINSTSNDTYEPRQTQPAPVINYIKQQPQVQVNNSNDLLTQFDGLMFLGVQPQPTIKPQDNLALITEQKIHNQTKIQAPVSLVPQITPPTVYPQQAVSQPNAQYPTMNNYANLYGNYQAYSPYPTYPAYQSQPSAQSYYNMYSPSYPTAPLYMPQQQPIYNQAYQTSQNYLTASYQPNVNYITSSPNPTIQQNFMNNQHSNKKQDDFGDFKNGGSFDIEKINWMSKKQKNLTDLTDFTIPAKDKAKPQKKKQYSNNIKIDPWAW